MRPGDAAGNQMLEILNSIKYVPGLPRTGVPDGPLTLLRQEQMPMRRLTAASVRKSTEDPRDLSSNLVVLGREA